MFNRLKEANEANWLKVTIKIKKTTVFVIYHIDIMVKVRLCPLRYASVTRKACLSQTQAKFLNACFNRGG